MGFGSLCPAAPSAYTNSRAKPDRVCERSLVLPPDVIASTRPVEQSVCFEQSVCVILHMRLAGITARRARVECRTVARRLRHPHRPRCHTLSTVAAIVLSAIVFALVYRGRWYIRYYIFLIRSRRRRYVELADGSYVYDAFVAHNSNNASWVVRHLLPRLETEGRYRLCLHQRDWPIGREISENIVESIEASRKVIVVLSNNFARSQWCRMELEMANHRRLSNWRNSLVLVLLETISPENQTATLRSLLTTHTYLRWNERAEEKFWRALRKALRRPPGAPPVEMRSVQGRARDGEREREGWRVKQFAMDGNIWWE